MKRGKTMQDHILGLLGADAEAEGYDVVISAEASNHGTLHAMTGMTSWCHVSYDFQSGYCEMWLYLSRDDERRWLV